MKEGEVIDTSPEMGKPLISGQTVVLTVSKGPEIVKKKVPNLVGMEVDTAIKALTNLGFETPSIERVYSAQAKDEVVGQSVEKDTEVDIKTVITLEVSDGPEQMEPSTDPSTDPPEEQLVTKLVQIPLAEGMLDSYEVTITHGKQVQTIEVLPDALYLEVELTGSGVQIYKISIPGADPFYVEVNFDEPEGAGTDAQ